MESCDKVYVAGHTGLLGSALVRRLRRDGFGNLLLKAHRELDLMDAGGRMTRFLLTSSLRI